MATLKESTYRAKTETFEIKFKSLSLDVRAFSKVLNCMSISARFTFMALSSFNDAIFFAFSTTTFRAGNHGNTSCIGNKVGDSLPWLY